MTDYKASISEDNGISKLTDGDLQIYSVGISTGGIAEIRMAQANPKRKIIATTIDEAGVEFAKEQISKADLDKQVEVKLEDVTKSLPYDDSIFDYVYARLVLHYLSKQDLMKALLNLYKVLKPGGKLFVVVRSANTPSASSQNARIDPVTQLTSYTHVDKKTGETEVWKRYFHTEESISKYVAEAGFKVSYSTSYDEDLYVDFMRTVKAAKTDNVIELLAVK